MNKIKSTGFIFILILLCSGCDPAYVFHAAVGQFHLITGSIPVQEALTVDSLTPEEETRLRMVARIKSFGEQELGLKETENYESVYLGSPNRPIYTISASPKDRLTRKTWWFPIIGDLPYLGFFDLDRAREKKAQLEAEDLDVSMGVADAYSTLGWFKDPVTLNLLQGSTPDLAETILHEMTHTTLYLKGQSAFNEGLAVLVGKVGAYQFFEQYVGPSHPFTAYAKAAIDDERIFSNYIGSLMNELEALYGSPFSDDEKLTGRKQIFARSLEEFNGLKKRFQTNQFSGFGQRPLNNAYVLAVGLYHRHFHLFESVLQRKGGSIRDTLSFFKTLSRTSDDVMQETEVWLPDPLPTPKRKTCRMR